MTISRKPTITITTTTEFNDKCTRTRKPDTCAYAQPSRLQPANNHDIWESTQKGFVHFFGKLTIRFHAGAISYSFNNLPL